MNESLYIKENKVYLLFRRGEPEHIRALYEEGEIYINTIDFIRNCDQIPDRSDQHDSIDFRKFIGEGKISFCDV